MEFCLARENLKLAKDGNASGVLADRASLAISERRIAFALVVQPSTACEGSGQSLRPRQRFASRHLSGMNARAGGATSRCCGRFTDQIPRKIAGPFGERVANRCQIVGHCVSVSQKGISSRSSSAARMARDIRSSPSDC